MEFSLEQIITAMPAAEQLQLSEQLSTWYNDKLREYCRDFDIQDDCMRDLKTRENAIVFFRTALMWWYKRKPVVEETLQPLQMLQTRVCLGQIQSLKTRLEQTDITLDLLKLNEHY